MLCTCKAKHKLCSIIIWVYIYYLSWCQ